MANLSLTMACGPYDRIEALRSGAVQPEGIDLKCLSVQPLYSLVDRAVKNQEFDIAEMFLALHMARKAQGQWPFVALPAFPSRVFRHGFTFVNTKSGIKTAKDLEGKRVGLPEYRQTAAVWIKGILQHEYGVRLEAIHWFEGGLDIPRQRDELDIPPEGPVAPQFIPEGKTLNDMLEKGELDAYMGGIWPPSFPASPNIKRLFPNYRELEREYYRKTGIFPVMHTLVIKESLYREHPWVAQSIFNAMVEAKKWTLDRIDRGGGILQYMLPWMYDELEEMYSLMGPDPWPYGLEANRATLDTLVGYLVEQGLMPKQVPLEELFVPVETKA